MSTPRPFVYQRARIDEDTRTVHTETYEVGDHGRRSLICHNHHFLGLWPASRILHPPLLAIMDGGLS